MRGLYIPTGCRELSVHLCRQNLLPWKARPLDLHWSMKWEKKKHLPILSIGFINHSMLLLALLLFSVCYRMGKSKLGAASSTWILEWGTHKSHPTYDHCSSCSQQIPFMRNTPILWVNEIWRLLLQTYPVEANWCIVHLPGLLFLCVI